MGYYGFHDYATALWWKHVQQVLTASELDTELARKVLQTAQVYLTGIEEIGESEAFDASLEAIQSLKSKLEGVPKDLRNWNSFKIYDLRLVAVRKVLEIFVNQPQEHNEATIALFGPWRHKCRKPWYLVETDFVNSDYQGKSGKSALQAAVEQGHLHIVQSLIRKGANVDIMMSRPAKGNRSLVNIAVKNRDLEIVTFHCGLDRVSLNGISHDYWTMSMCMDLIPFPRSIMAQLLRNATPKSNERLFSECHGCDIFSRNHPHALLLRLDALLSSGKIDPNVRDPMGNRPIDAACARGDYPIFQRLCAVTTASDIQDGSGNTLMQLATKGSHYAMVEFIIKERADINTANEACSIPLQLATNSEVRRLLVDNSAKMHPVDHSDRLMRDAIHTML
ncbi:ankyrin repeat-containing domain protein [Fusarium venenatum]|nr:ankyrin repeat-containing domain protein [Fusarium venenatum]